MKAGIILVGTELLNGGTIDTNSIFIAEELNKYGIEIEFKMSVRDIMDEIIKVIDYGKKNVDLLIISGGLGPTIDDITKDAIGQYLNLPLIVDDSDLIKLKEKFSHLDIPFLESNIRQIEMPQGSITFENDKGMALGIFINGIAAFPGVPREVYNLIPKFLNWYSKEMKLIDDNIYIKDILTFGLGESILDDKLKKIFTEDGIHYEFLVKSYGTLVRLQSFAHNVDKVTKIEKKIYEEIGEYIFGEDRDTLESVLVKKLKELNYTISTAESCTGGLISSKIVNVEGSSKVFLEGYVTYSNMSKEKNLGVSKETLDKYGAVSEETAREMLSGLTTDVGIVSTGIAGPTSDDTEKPVGLVYIGIKLKNKYHIKKYQFNPRWGRNRIRDRAASQSLFDLIKLLRK